MATTHRRRLSNQGRGERRAADRERLHQAAQQLLTSDGWQRWVRVRARGGLARLSLYNQLLVALCCPDATFVAGFKAWLALGIACARARARLASSPRWRSRTETTTASQTRRLSRAAQDPVPRGQSISP